MSSDTRSSQRESRFFTKTLREVKQQELRPVQPILTPVVIIVALLAVAIVFMPIGFVLLDASQNVVEKKKRYDNIDACHVTGRDNSSALPKECNVTLTLSDDMDAPVFFYYEVHNYHQNHRRYLKSKDDEQLRGDPGATSFCTPVRKRRGDKLYPCGLVAATFFTDRFRAAVNGEELCNSTTRCVSYFNRTEWQSQWHSWFEEPHWSQQGIAWRSDRTEKFKSKDRYYEKEGFSRQGKRQEKSGLLLPKLNNKDLIAWMRSAGLPKFRKLHRIIRHKDLKKGDTITVTIFNWFSVKGLNGEKWIVLSTANWSGGKNLFLAWTYIAVSIAAIVLAVTFAVLLLVGQRSLKATIQVTNGSVVWTV